MKGPSSRCPTFRVPLGLSSTTPGPGSGVAVGGATGAAPGAGGAEGVMNCQAIAGGHCGVP